MDTITITTLDTSNTYYITGSTTENMRQIVNRLGATVRKGQTAGFVDSDAQIDAIRRSSLRVSTTQAAAQPIGSRMATERQISYLRSLGVRIETGLTLDRASELIDAAKRREMGSVSGFYRDGSN